MHFRPSGLILLALGATLFNCAAAQTLPRELKVWTLEYSIAGGLAGLSLILTSAGAKYELEAHDGIARVLTDTMDAALKKAFVGAWWQSARKLCQPVTQLTAADIDPPI